MDAFKHHEQAIIDRIDPFKGKFTLRIDDGREKKLQKNFRKGKKVTLDSVEGIVKRAKSRPERRANPAERV